MNSTAEVDEVTKVVCPTCETDATYLYGKTRSGRQRYMCIVCGTQFSNGGKSLLKGKPKCPECGKTMNIYKLEGNIIRFRCSGYPECKTFRKFTMKEVT